MKKNVYFVIESEGDFTLAPLIERHLSGHAVSVGNSLPVFPENYHLIVLWNLRRIIRDLPATNNVVVFHSSDLPRGRGWAPIYHALANGFQYHVITAILAGPEVDAGDVIAKARFRIQACHTSDSLRALDEEVCVMIAAAILNHFGNQPIRAMPQHGQASYYARRSPSDSGMDINQPLVDLIPHIRGCGSSYPAYVDWQGCRYRITLTPESLPVFPEDLQIEFSDATGTA
jgi:methionyl-tRNA formyltransferase